MPDNFDAARVAMNIGNTVGSWWGQEDPGPAIAELIADVQVALIAARKAPKGHVIDENGVVRKLPATADGKVPFDPMPVAWWDGDTLRQGAACLQPRVFFYDPATDLTFEPRLGLSSCYSTREAAEAGGGR